MAQAERIT